MAASRAGTAHDVCADHGQWCTFVNDLTHNTTLAHAADWLIAKPLSIIGLIIAAFVIRWILHRVIDRLVRRASSGSIPAMLAQTKVHQLIVDANPASVERRRQRAETMGSLFKSIVTTIIVMIVVFMAVAQLGYDIAPLLASAGIVGVALGFGAQSLVRDYLSGICMILEDQFGVGDVINVGAATGVVEAVGLRVTRLRDGSGAVWYVPNGQILAVSNISQDWSQVILDIPMSLRESVGRVRGVLQEVADGLAADPAFSTDILEPPQIWGVEQWDPDGMIVRLAIKTTQPRSGPVAREMRERVKTRFDTEGIEIAVPARSIWRDEPVAASDDTATLPD